MGLPEFNLQAKGMSSDKQMAMMRTYLGQLKDETETQLFDIKWDNLSSDLKKKIDDLETSISSVSEYSQLTAQNIKANYIAANGISAITIDASQIKSGYISANRIKAGSITADKLSTSYIETSWITIDSGFAASFAAQRLTAAQMSAIRIDASQINAGKINADRLDANTIRSKVSGSASSYITTLFVGDVKVQSGISMAVADRQNGFFTPHYLSGSNLYVLAWSPTQTSSINAEEAET